MNPDTEYDNRARVPEHPQIIARWVEQAQEYRNNSDCDVDLAYGDMQRQRCDMFKRSAAIWSGAGTPALHIVVPDKNHFSMIEQLADSESHMVKTMLNIAKIK